MNRSNFTDYNILARDEGGATAYKVVGLKRVFAQTEEYEDFEERFESLEHVANKIMETLDASRIPKLHSTLFIYTETIVEKISGRGASGNTRMVQKEIKKHLPGKLQSQLNDRLPGSNVTTIEEMGRLVGYRTINAELPILVTILNQALAARKRGEQYDAVHAREMRDSEPPITF